MRWSLALLTAWLACAAAGRAQPESAGVGAAPALNWVRLAGAESCADSVEVARKVEAHLGRRIFWSASEAEESIEAVVAREDASWTLALHVQARDGRRGERRLRTEARECDALIEEAVVVIAALIDPQQDPGATRIAPEVDDTLEAAFGAEPTEPDPAALTASGPRPAATDEREAAGAAPASAGTGRAVASGADRLRLRASLAALGALGRLPGMGAGIAGGLVLALPGSWAAQLELLALLPKTETAEGSTGSLTLARYDGRLRLCPLDLGPWSACAGGGLGVVSGSAADFVHSRPLSYSLAADLDVHARYRVRLASDFSLTFAATLSLALRRPKFVFRTEPAPRMPGELYSTPALGGLLAVGAEIDL